MITGLKVLKDSKNKQINLWPKYNPIKLDKMMMKV